MEIDPHARYLSAREIEVIYGISAKTTLNRSNLKSTNPRYLPSLRLKGGRKKYFERKVVERFFCTASNPENGGQK